VLVENRNRRRDEMVALVETIDIVHAVLSEHKTRTMRMVPSIDIALVDNRKGTGMELAVDNILIVLCQVVVLVHLNLLGWLYIKEDGRRNSCGIRLRRGVEAVHPRYHGQGTAESTRVKQPGRTLEFHVSVEQTRTSEIVRTSHEQGATSSLHCVRSTTTERHAVLAQQIVREDGVIATEPAHKDHRRN